MGAPNRRVILPKTTAPKKQRRQFIRPPRPTAEEQHAAYFDPNADAWQLLEIKKKPQGVCRRCFAVYLDDHWHRLDVRRRRTAPRPAGQATLCDACKIELGANPKFGFVGEVRIGNVSARLLPLVLQTIRNVGRTAFRRNSAHRIILIEQKGRGARVTTTENQLAVRIGKKLDESFKGGKLKISYSEMDAPIRVTWMPPS